MLEEVKDLLVMCIALNLPEGVDKRLLKSLAKLQETIDTLDDYMTSRAQEDEECRLREDCAGCRREAQCNALSAVAGE